MDLDLSGKTALVTGSSRGIGFETAVGLVEMGAKIIVHGRTNTSVNDALARLEERIAAADAVGIAADLGTAAGCDAIAAAHPMVDVLVNNVGIYRPEPFNEVGDDTWQVYLTSTSCRAYAWRGTILKGCSSATGDGLFLSLANPASSSLRR